MKSKTNEMEGSPEIRDANDPQEEIKKLREELSFFKKDGLEGSLFALNYQVNKINQVILETKITLSENDKQFERFWKILTEIGSIHEAILKLKDKQNSKSVTKEKEKYSESSPASSIMEKMAFGKNEIFLH